MIRSTQIETVRLSFDSRCGACGAPLSAGTDVKRDADALWPTCLTCAAGRGSIPALQLVGSAGASARREYERRRESREARYRARFGRLGGLFLRLAGKDESVERWRRGADGERLVARRLEKHLAGRGCIVLHDRRIPGHGAANIDHIVIGPGGVTVIDTKKYSGRVRVVRRGPLFSRRTALFVGGRDRSHLVVGVRRQAAVVSAALDRAGLSIDIRSALCFTEPDGLPWGRQDMDGVLIDGPRRVAKLACRRGQFDETGVELVARAVADAFPPA